MKAITCALVATASISLFLGTADLVLLLAAVFASQLPSVDTSKSLSGRILLPISSWLEQHYPRQTITHSFLATAAIAVLFSPVALLNFEVWLALVLGYFCGWFVNVFTKTGVEAFYPNPVRLVIPANPRLRLSTDSNAEYLVMAVLVGVAIASISINSSGGILRVFNSTLGIPSGAVEIASAEGSKYLLFATIDGRVAVTQQPVKDDFEIVRPLTQHDLLVKDSEGTLYRAGTSQECQIMANRITIKRDRPIYNKVQQIQLEDQYLSDTLANLPKELATRTYITSSLTLPYADDLIIPSHSDRFDAITLQPGQGSMIVRLESASPALITSLIGDYEVTGNLLIRSVEVL